MLVAEFRKYHKAHKYIIKNHKEDFYWAFPKWGVNITVENASYLHPAKTIAPPSEQLKALIAADAPMYVIVDKFIEEYPELEADIMKAYLPEGEAQSAD